ncbi:MAG: fumarate hydratase [Lentisphaeria bacterium]|nr:fumarate hydratase [Lentisphaeria bacterium]
MNNAMVPRPSVTAPPDTWVAALHDLLVRASTRLPDDVTTALECGLATEQPGSNAARALSAILANARLARQSCRPLCQDTGAIIFHVDAPVGVSQTAFRSAVEKAVIQATEEGVLRQNCVDSLSGKNSGDNLGAGNPAIHWHEDTGSTLRMAVTLKGGGCENVGAQYALPDSGLHAGRDLEGVRRCLLDAVVKAQGKGCAPGILGVCIGGDRASGYVESKRQLLRPLTDTNPVPELDKLEQRILKEANTLGIGPMGFSGRTTLLGVKIGALHRVPASYFVSMTYMCWACRRQTVELEIS